MWSMISSLSSRGSLVRYDFSGSIGTSCGSCGGWDRGGSELDRVAHGGADAPGLDLGVIENPFTSLPVCVSMRFAGLILPSKPLT